MKRAWQLLGWVAIAVAVFFAWPSQWGGHTTFVVVKGNSMLPNFHTGDIVIARTTDHLEIGDVVVYAVPDGAGAGKLIMHRLVGVEADGTLVIQGDNRDEPDQFVVTADDVAGVARVHVPKGGLLVRYMGTWWFIAAAISLFVLVQLWPDDDENTDDEKTDDENTDGESTDDAERGDDADVGLKGAGDPSGSALAAEVVSGQDPKSRVFVDGDAAMAELWGDLTPDVARRRCLELCAAGAHTFGTHITLVFPHGTRGSELRPVDPGVAVVTDGRSVRELVRAAPRGALDSIEAVVVTSDAGVRRDVQAAGAATISCQIWRDLITG